MYDPALIARISRRRPLLYTDGADPALDRPGHVRAASGLAWVGTSLLVVQDDAHFIGVIDPTTGRVEAITLPAGPSGRRQFETRRGNKADKLDLEAAFAMTSPRGDVLVALGSGAALGPRRSVVRVTRTDGRWDVEVRGCPAWFDAVAAAVLPPGTSLNLEGAAVLGDTLVLANRGGDTSPEGAVSPDAMITLPLAAWLRVVDAPGSSDLPDLTVRRYQLGHLAGTALHVTDLASARGRVFYLAAAEATTSFYDDGEVLGCAIGVLDEPPRWTPILDEHGAPARDKLEGLAPTEDPSRWLAVSDADDPDRTSELIEVVLEGPW